MSHAGGEKPFFVVADWITDSTPSIGAATDITMADIPPLPPVNANILYTLESKILSLIRVLMLTQKKKHFKNCITS